MTPLGRRLARLEQPHGRPDEPWELAGGGVVLTAAELARLLREISGTRTQNRIDPEDNAP